MVRQGWAQRVKGSGLFSPSLICGAKTRGEGHTCTTPLHQAGRHIDIENREVWVQLDILPNQGLAKGCIFINSVTETMNETHNEEKN